VPPETPIPSDQLTNLNGLSAGRSAIQCELKEQHQQEDE
jgi:hypothetical protein